MTDKTPDPGIRLFGHLHSLRRQRSLPTVAEVYLPVGGRPAIDAAGKSTG